MSNSSTPAPDRCWGLLVEERCISGGNVHEVRCQKSEAPADRMLNDNGVKRSALVLPDRQRAKSLLKVLIDKDKSIREDSSLAACPEVFGRAGRRLKRPLSDEVSFPRDPPDIIGWKSLRSRSVLFDGFPSRGDRKKSRTVSADKPLLRGDDSRSRRRHGNPASNGCSFEHVQPKTRSAQACSDNANPHANDQEITRRSARIKERAKLKKKKIREEKQSSIWDTSVSPYGNRRHRKPARKRQKTGLTNRGRNHGKEGWAGVNSVNLNIVSNDSGHRGIEDLAAEERDGWKSRLRERAKRNYREIAEGNVGVDHRLGRYADHGKIVKRKVSGGGVMVSTSLPIEIKDEEREPDVMITWIRRHRRNARARTKPQEIVSSSTEEESPDLVAEANDSADAKLPNDARKGGVKSFNDVRKSETFGKVGQESDGFVKEMKEPKFFVRRKSRALTLVSASFSVDGLEAIQESPLRFEPNQKGVPDADADAEADSPPSPCTQPLITTTESLERKNSADAKLCPPSDVGKSSTKEAEEENSGKLCKVKEGAIPLSKRTVVDSGNGKGNGTELVVEVDLSTSDDQVKDGSPAERKSECGSHYPPTKFQVLFKEGLRCGLCGGNRDGEPEIAQVGNVSSGNPDDDGSGFKDGSRFGDKTGWLGRLLGPLSERVGVAGAWVHEVCAIWSPEVYFAGVGRLKNVKAAIRRGRHLKCFRCGQAGATIGCRVDRCLQNFHLPCARFEGCVFDHKKYLMACPDHIYLFRPQLHKTLGHGGGASSVGNSKLHRGNFRRAMLERRAAAAAARSKDHEDEEKCMEKSGEDEEFTRRESKRLQRDIARIVPIMLGGPGENGNRTLFPDGWASVAGLQNVVESLKEMVMIPLLYPEAFPRMGITPPRGVLLHGHPGTGKTLVVRALAGACASGPQRVAYFARKGADCLGKYVGDAERQLRLLFHVAERHQPSIIFFDEIDGLAPSRLRDRQDQTHSSVVSTLLALMDGLNSRGSVIVIGATNRPDSLDPALRRPGRFDREICFPLPSASDRAAILALHTKTWEPQPSRELLSAVASAAQGFAGADLQALCTETAMKALKRVMALHQLMKTVEEGKIAASLHSLPSVQVKSVDWFAALSEAPPPCSRRDGSAPLSSVSPAPLPWYFIPVLLPSIVEVLICLHLDGRNLLPLSISKVVSQIIVVLRAAADEVFKLKGSSAQKSGSLLDHMSTLLPVIQAYPWENQLNNCLEEAAAVGGLVSTRSEALYNTGLDSGISSGGYAADLTDGNRAASLHLRPVLDLWKGCRFRVLLSGGEKHGQELVAAALLHSFEGSISLHKLMLATMLHEGLGVAIHGLAHFLGGLNFGSPCMVYMPQIESWAVKEVVHDTIVDGNSSARAKDHWPDTSSVSTSHCSPESIHNQSTSFISTPLWATFMQSIQTVTPDASIMLLATSQLCKERLPQDVLQFFNQSRGNGLLSKYSTIPCVGVEMPILKGTRVVLKRASQEITTGLASKYLQHVNHPINISSSVENLGSKSVTVDSESPSLIGNQEVGKPDEVLSQSARKKAGENGKNSSDVLHRSGQQEISHGVNPAMFIPPEDSLRALRSEDSFKAVPSRSPFVSTEQKSVQSAIACFCYELLYQPQYSPLRYATSRLNAGPSFNVGDLSCSQADHSMIRRYMEGESRQEMDSRPSDDSRDLSEEQTPETPCVYGLIAVGLKGKKGLYVSVTEAAGDVKLILRLLKQKIRDKVQSRGRYWRYFPLLSQSAALRDVVSSWLYHHRRFAVAKAVTISNISEVEAIGGKCEQNLQKSSIFLPTSSGVERPPSRSGGADMEQCSLAGITEPCIAAASGNFRNSSKRKPLQLRSECLQDLERVLWRYLVKSWKQQGRLSTVGDVNEIIADCTVSATGCVQKLIETGGFQFSRSADQSDTALDLQRTKHVNQLNSRCKFRAKLTDSEDTCHPSEDQHLSICLCPLSSGINGL